MAMEVEGQLVSWHGHLVCGASRPGGRPRWRGQLQSGTGSPGLSRVLLALCTILSSSTVSLLHFLRESIVGTDTLCKEDTISVSKEDFNALEIVTNEIYNHDKDTNGNVITIDHRFSRCSPPSSWSSRGGV